MGLAPSQDGLEDLFEDDERVSLTADYNCGGGMMGMGGLTRIAKMLRSAEPRVILGE